MHEGQNYPSIPFLLALEREQIMLLTLYSTYSAGAAGSQDRIAGTPAGLTRARTMKR